MYSGLARYRSALPRSCRSVFRPTRALKTPQQRRCTPSPQHQPERFCRPKDRPTKADNPRPTHTPVGRGFSPTRALKTPQQRRCTPLPQHQPERFCRPKDRPTKADNPRPTHTPVGRGFSPTRALKTPQPNPPHKHHTTRLKTPYTSTCLRRSFL